MSKPQKIKNKNGTTSYRIFISTGNGKRESKTFSTKQYALDWYNKRKHEIQREELYGKHNITIKAAIEIYEEKFTTNVSKSRLNSLSRIKTYPLSSIFIDKLTTKDIIDFAIERNKQVLPQTTAMDISTIKMVISTISISENLHYDETIINRAISSLRQKRLIADTTKRNRLPTFAEMLKLTKYFKRKTKAKIPMADIIWFAYFSSRRLSEITRIRWEDNNDEKQTGMVRDAKHPTKKQGNNIRFKYEKSAYKIILRQPRTDERIFPFNPESISSIFNVACKATNIQNLHFHDLRHAAATRLFSKGYSIEQVQQFTLHMDWKTLARYTHIKPEDI